VKGDADRLQPVAAQYQSGGQGIQASRAGWVILIKTSYEELIASKRKTAVKTSKITTSSRKKKKK